MKKLLLIAAVAALALNMALWGASITVTSPNSGSEWCIGSPYTITWTSSGMTGTVSIILRLAGAPAADPVLGISVGIANDGTEGWTIPATVTAGTYLVRIRSVDTPEVFDDSADFIIKDCSSGSITVTNPHGQGWCVGSHYNIQWTSPGVAAGNVHIILRQAGAPAAPPVLAIASDTANDGTEGWTIPETVADGDYLIRIRTVSDSPYVYDDSSNFHIGHCITFPHDWWKKKYYEVKWPIGPDPCRCPEWNIKDLLDRIREVNPKFVGSLGLLKNGMKIQELGQLGGRRLLGDTLKPTLSRKNFDAFKNGTAKFSMGLFDGQGNLVQEIELQGEQQLR